MERNPLTVEEILAVLPDLTEDEIAEAARNPAVTNTDRDPVNLDDAWTKIKPEDYWL
jgi:hypothetical protein